MSISLKIKFKKNSVKKKVRKGRGNSSGYGTQAGRGHKGQKSRSGYSRRAGFEGGQTPLYRRLPKKRGQGNNLLSKKRFTPVNLELLNKFYLDGDTVSTLTLVEKGIIKKKQIPKILGKGSLTKKIEVDLPFISNKSKENLYLKVKC